MCDIYADDQLSIIGVHDSTASRTIKTNGFSKHNVQFPTAGYKLSEKQLAIQMVQWLKQAGRDGNFEYPSNQIASNDFTYTGHRIDRHTTWAGKGGPQRRSKTKIFIYTNCIITCLWADG